MARYVAFIRGINVGGSAVAKMDSIRRQFEALSLENVVTVLASGNVVFDARTLDEDVLSKKLGAKLSLALGREVHVIVRQAGSIINLVDGIPFAHVKAAENVRLLVTPPAERHCRIRAGAQACRRFKGCQQVWHSNFQRFND